MMYWIPPVVMILGMAGGQIEKAIRRYGIPGISLIAAYLYAIKNQKNKLKPLALFLLIPILSMGYGINSCVNKLTGRKEWLTRVMFALLLSMPFIAFGKVFFMALPALIAAFQVRAGSLGKIGDWDILIEDMVRYFVLGILIMYAIGGV